MGSKKEEEETYTTIMSNFINTELHSAILDAAEKHKGQHLNFRFKSEDMLKILQNLENTPEMPKIVDIAFKEALDKSDKRPMTDQLRLKAKFQKSHGLVFKDIPINVERSVIFNAIMKIGRTMDMTWGRLMFPGACKLRSFFFPQVKNPEIQDKRVCFPIFVNKKDQTIMYQWAQNQGGQIQLELEGDRTGWDGIVSVEMTRDECKDDQHDESAKHSLASSRKSSFSASSGYATPVFAPQMSLQTLNAMPFVNGPTMPNVSNGVAPLLVQTLLKNTQQTASLTATVSPQARSPTSVGSPANIVEDFQNFAPFK